MRVIAGEFGGRPLKSLPGKTTRPTTDKVKGAIFNMIGPYFNGGRSLDLYAGSGGLSIEAVSRGIAQAILVEKDRKAQAIVTENIAMTKRSSAFQLLKMDDKRALAQLDGRFDLVFLDPPYAKEEIVAVIESLSEKALVDGDSLIVCETDKAVTLPETIGPFRIKKQKHYGISQVTIYEQ
ncbi:16S rRNA (guanine(966)-N(2))-methyltransferase RsmD [Streptococcus sp. DD12]|uniref:16S rRNA (guanine(966)-N(2))-methyltransferase RsmD n=1 Tax=Streptococcus sp. DD12 TaxID=1777880 RepID=UPI000799E294|nr:16S rRNA (guanine(966)-N(2))-methyltransferase RsmD [Streptococcus sp. DD12]KXT76673.1 Ribosomal RNA small subunit methyltransferase D [Streptococcus sp. DD12]